jgi:predicted acetyltransferase
VTTAARHRPQPVLTDVTEETSQDYLKAVMRGFHGEFHEEHWDFDRRLFEVDRCFGFTAGDRWVATCGAFTRTMTTPGGSVPIGAVTIVTVAPTHRRQGLLTVMMRHQLADLHRRKEPVALLWASESAIYGRFGYGSAVPRLVVSGRTTDTAFLPTVDLGDGWVDEVTKDEYGAVVPDLHARLLPDRPGALDRSPVFWERDLLDRPEDRKGAPPVRYALHVDAAGQVDGYARFKVSSPWSGDLPDAEVEILEIDASDTQARAGLWRFLFDLDLVRRFRCHGIAVDEPLRYLLANPRILTTTLTDSTYVRIVDLPKALANRRYGADLDVVVQVSDPLLEHNDGTYRIQAEAGESARVTKAGRRRPDVSLGIRELGSIYLGGTSLTALHRAGLVSERTPGAVAAMTMAFDWPQQPYCPDDF